MTDTISDQPVNIVQHLSAKEPDIFPAGIGRDQKVKREGLLDLHSKRNSRWMLKATVWEQVFIYVIAVSLKDEMYYRCPLVPK